MSRKRLAERERQARGQTGKDRETERHKDIRTEHHGKPDPDWDRRTGAQGRRLLPPWGLPSFGIWHAVEFLRTGVPCCGTSVNPPTPCTHRHVHTHTCQGPLTHCIFSELSPHPSPLPWLDQGKGGTQAA